MQKINTCKSLGNFFFFFFFRYLKEIKENYCMPGGRYRDKQNKIMYTNRQEKYDIKLEDSYCPLVLSRGWVLYKIGAFSFRNEVKHGMTSIKKAEFMASVAKRRVDFGNFWKLSSFFFFLTKLLLAFF